VGQGRRAWRQLPGSFRVPGLAGQLGGPWGAARARRGVMPRAERGVTTSESGDSPPACLPRRQRGARGRREGGRRQAVVSQEREGTGRPSAAGAAVFAAESAASAKAGLETRCGEAEASLGLRIPGYKPERPAGRSRGGKPPGGTEASAASPSEDDDPSLSPVFAGTSAGDSRPSRGTNAGGPARGAPIHSFQMRAPWLRVEGKFRK
jgi:hypothetical protein